MPSVSTDLLLFGGRALILLLGFAALVVCFMRWEKAARQQTQDAAARIEVALGEIRSLREVGEGTNAALQALTEQVQTQLRLAKAASAPSATGYDVAIRLARNGASTDEVVSTSGVTRQEAELLARLHGPDTARHRMTA